MSNTTMGNAHSHSTAPGPRITAGKRGRGGAGSVAEGRGGASIKFENKIERDQGG